MTWKPEWTEVVTNQFIPVLIAAAFWLIPPICLLAYLMIRSGA
jgi:hypothetical protein